MKTEKIEKQTPAGRAPMQPIQGELGQKVALRLMFARILPLWRPILLGVLFTALASAIQLGYGKLAKDVLDTITRQGGSVDLKLINQYAWIAISVTLARGVLNMLNSYAWGYTAQKLSRKLREDVFSHLQRMSQSFFDHRRTGQLISLMNSDIQAATNVLDALQECVSAPLIFVGGTILLFWLDWPLALLSLVVLPPSAWIILKTSKRVREYAKQLQAGRAEVLDVAQESLSSIRVVRAFANEEFEINRFRRSNNNVFRLLLRSMRARLAMRPLLNLLGVMAGILVIWAGCIRIAQGDSGFTVGELLWFILVLGRVADAAQEVGGVSVTLSQAGVAADRVFTILGMASEIREKPDALALKEVAGRVSFEEVSFSYSAGIPVLAGLSFRMEPGQVTAVVGPTGAGKTTIASLIPRFYDVTEGRITVDGTDIRDCTLASLRAQIGIVPQDTTLFAGSLRENIAYGRLGAKDEEIIQAAKLANAWEFIEKLPQGLETKIGERGVMLSGGQRQRIAIARAVLRNPRILILDEATSSLDARSEALIQEALQKLVADRTTLVIAHRLSTIRNADQILVVREGQIVEQGRHEELLACGGAYSELYRTQFREQEERAARAAAGNATAA